MEAHDEGEVGGLLLRDVQIPGPAATDQGGDQHVVAKAGNREQLGDALDEANDDGLGIGQVMHDGLSLRGRPAPGARIFTPGRSWVNYGLLRKTEAEKSRAGSVSG